MARPREEGRAETRRTEARGQGAPTGAEAGDGRDGAGALGAAGVGGEATWGEEGAATGARATVSATSAGKGGFVCGLQGVVRRQS